MDRFWKEVALSLLLGVALPGLLLRGAVTIAGRELQIARLEAAEQTDAGETEATETESPSLEVLVRNGEEVPARMSLDDYLTGVVLGEMPAAFHEEALKAQAVVARTYTLKAAATGGKHGDGSICTDSTCCQAYLSPAAYLEQGGAEEAVEKVQNAVLSTKEAVLTYGGSLIEATYFSCSGGSTEAAVAVWGTDLPYLQATDSPGEEKAAHYTDSVFFTPSEFCGKLGIDLEGSPKSWFGMTTYTEGGGVSSMEIGGVTYQGTELRALLGLRSTAITVRADENGITLETRGYGHRVGMSQYGADAMAASGSGWQEILAHYYRDTRLENFTPGEV